MQERIYILDRNNSIANQILQELRDKTAQQNRMQFRQNMVKLGSILAYEISKSLDYQTIEVETVLGHSSINVPSHQPVLVTIIRAGLPFMEGFQNFFDRSDCGFIGAHRMEGNIDDIEIALGYQAVPSFEGKDLIVVDPMLATGQSLLASMEILLKMGTPGSLHLAFAIAAPEGIELLKKHLKVPFNLWIGALDQGLNHKGYIVPGLGDAGDLLFGKKN